VAASAHSARRAGHVRAAAECFAPLASRRSRLGSRVRVAVLAVANAGDDVRRVFLLAYLDHLTVADLGSKHLEAFTYECGEAGPALGGNELAVDMGSGRRHVDIGPTGDGHLRLAIL